MQARRGITIGIDIIGHAFISQPRHNITGKGGITSNGRIIENETDKVVDRVAGSRASVLIHGRAAQKSQISPALVSAF